ncbi:transcription termination factor NusA [Patescibacteria group bacterium]|nr:transcription termination factor NusA [Patescibacteria group bacterium]MBU1721524.1 transcription termination factor NusA [Patescibacteria group bacterium]MBU1901490.1 transcription termination factor NusA [Patescibacteria group bacterium]
MSSEVAKSIQYICDEKGIDYDIVMEAIESALGAAYRKDFGHRQQNIKVKFDPETADMHMWDVKIVVEDIEEEALLAAQEELAKRREKASEEGRELTEEETEDLPRFNPKVEMMLTEAKELKKDVTVGETLEIPLEIPGDFGRMAAQTAKQVIIQKLREAERINVFEDFQDQVGHIVQATIQRKDRQGNILVDLGKITGLLPQNEQIQKEFYRPGIRMKFFVSSVGMGPRGPEILLSRSHEDMVRAVFEQEIPEIANGEVIIKGIARDPGFRSKVAVSTDDESIDPIGSCIGQRGSRITVIIEELGGEKVDIIQYNENSEEYIKEALSPAKVTSVELHEEEKIAVASVAEDQFSLAIGKAGQNVRLAAALTGWQINVVDLGEGKEVSSEESQEEIVEKVEVNHETEK